MARSGRLPRTAFRVARSTARLRARRVAVRGSAVRCCWVSHRAAERDLTLRAARDMGGFHGKKVTLSNPVQIQKQASVPNHRKLVCVRGGGGRPLRMGARSSNPGLLLYFYTFDSTRWGQDDLTPCCSITSFGRCGALVWIILKAFLTPEAAFSSM